MKIAFHDNQLGIRGTTVALYDYAYFSREILDIEPIIIYKKNHRWNDQYVIDTKFKLEFQVFGYDGNKEMDSILEKQSVDAAFFIKSGQLDGVISNVTKNLINAIAPCGKNDVHGDVFAMGSKWLSKITNWEIPYVPYMINIPDTDEDLRNKMNIPKDAIVVGRNGGYTTFDLDFVKKAITDMIESRDDMYFLFQCTEPFIKHDRVIFLDCSPDMNYKVKFINSCDVMLHARHLGESFGLSCGEFSVRNKRIITWDGSKERNHIDILGEAGIYFQDYASLKNILLNLSKSDLEGNWNCYQEYLPPSVMETYREIYLQ